MNETIVFCIPGTTFSHRFLACWTATLQWCQSNGINAVLKQAVGADVFQVRNKLLGEPKYGPNQKPLGGISYDYLMFLDSDQTFNVADFQLILNTMRNNKDVQVVAGVYPRVTNEETRFSTIYKMLDSSIVSLAYRLVSYEEIESWPELQKIDGAGMGFTMFRHGVFEQIKYPWFHQIEIIDLNTNEIVGYTAEDLTIYLKLKEVGIDLYCLSNLRIGHEKTRVFMGGQYE